MGDWPSPLRHARRALADHSALTLNAGTLAFATIANGILGFAYWWVSARSFTPTSVGLASADISLLSLLSLAADVGLGTMLQGEIPRRRLAPHLVSAALLASVASAGILGLAYLAVTAVFAPSFGVWGRSLNSPPGRRWRLRPNREPRARRGAGRHAERAAAPVQKPDVRRREAAFRRRRRGDRDPGRLAAQRHHRVLGGWSGCGPLFGRRRRLRGARIWYRPRFDALGRLIGVAFWHYVVNVAATAPTLVLPVIIALLLSPEQNAPFYSAWMLLSLAGVLPAALANVLFSVGSGASSRAASSLRFSLSVSLGVGVVAAVGFWLLSNVALNMLNPVYADLVGSDLRFLGVSVPLMAVKQHYMAVQRLDGRVRVAASRSARLARSRFFRGPRRRGRRPVGGDTGWLLAMGLEAACLWPTVWRGFAATGAGPAATAQDRGRGPPNERRAFSYPAFRRGTSAS